MYHGWNGGMPVIEYMFNSYSHSKYMPARCGNLGYNHTRHGSEVEYND